MIYRLPRNNVKGTRSSNYCFTVARKSINHNIPFYIITLSFFWFKFKYFSRIIDWKLFYEDSNNPTKVFKFKPKEG